MVSMKQLLEAGRFMGIRQSDGTLKMKEYIFDGRGNGIYIIRSSEKIPLRDLEEAYTSRHVKSYGEGGTVLKFAGTKRQAQDVG